LSDEERAVQASNLPHTTPGEVAAEHGEVLIDGPNGLTTALTPDAAEETGKRLIDAADEARRQEPASPEAEPATKGP
jgi:hypothetical protein